MCQNCEKLGITPDMTHEEVFEIYAKKFKINYVGSLSDEVYESYELVNGNHAACSALMAFNDDDQVLLKLLEPVKAHILEQLKHVKESIITSMEIKTKFPKIEIDLNTQSQDLSDDAIIFYIFPSGGEVFVGSKINIISMINFMREGDHEEHEEPTPYSELN